MRTIAASGNPAPRTIQRTTLTRAHRRSRLASSAHCCSSASASLSLAPGCCFAWGSASAGKRMRPSTKVFAGQRVDRHQHARVRLDGHRAPQRPVRPGLDLVLGHPVREVDGDAHVTGIDGGVGADELPVQLRRVGEPLGGALGDVLHGEDGGSVGDVEVELHGDHACARVDRVGADLAAGHAHDGVLGELVGDRGRRVAGGRPGRATDDDLVGALGGEVPVDEVEVAGEVERAAVGDAQVAVGHDLRVDPHAGDGEALGRRGAGRQAGRSGGERQKQEEEDQQTRAYAARAACRPSDDVTAEALHAPTLPPVRPCCRAGRRKSGGAAHARRATAVLS